MTPPLSLPPPDTALPLAYCIVVCCLLLSASAIAIVVANATSACASAINAASSASPAALTFRPGGTSRGWGQHHGKVLFAAGREVKKVHFSPYFTEQRAFFSRWPGILRNPEDFGVNTGIPVPQEFLRKIPVKTEKNRNSCDLSKTTFL